MRTKCQVLPPLLGNLRTFPLCPAEERHSRMYPWGGEGPREGGSGLGETDDGKRGKRKAQAWGGGCACQK